MALVMLGLVLFFAVPIGLFVWLSVRANHKKSQEQVGPWMALAARYGGQFTPARGSFGGHRIVIPHAGSWLTVETRQVSQMDAMLSGFRYHSTAGVYTHVTAVFAGVNGPTLNLDPRAAANVGLAGAPWLPADARILSQNTEAVVVMRGAVADTTPIMAAIDLVSTLANHAAALRQAAMSAPAGR